MNHTRLTAALIALAAAFALASCGQPQPAYDPAVTPLTGIDAQNVSSIENADGDKPCGVFNVNGHGYKVVDVMAYPACDAKDYLVMCLNDKAEWTDANVSKVSVSGLQVTFTSAQEGSCGLFAAP